MARLATGADTQRPRPRRAVRVVFVGDVSKDRLVFGDEDKLKGAAVVRFAAGGGVFFGAVAAARLGAECHVITKAAPGDCALFDQTFAAAGVQVTYVPCAQSTSCENAFPDPRVPERRRLRMLSLAEPFTARELTHAFSSLMHSNRQPIDVIVVNALWYGMFPPALLSICRAFGAYVVVDAQGFLRHVAAETGAMTWIDWERKADYLPLVDLLKIDAHEALVLTGTDNIRLAARTLITRANARAVVATDASGVFYERGSRCDSGDGSSMAVSSTCSTGGNAYAGFGAYTTPGRTGRGDTVTAVFSVARAAGWQEQRALQLSALLTTAKMQYPGPFTGFTVSGNQRAAL